MFVLFSLQFTPRDLKVTKYNLSYTEFCWNINFQPNSEHKEFLYKQIVAQMGKKFSAFMKPATSITVANWI